MGVGERLVINTLSTSIYKVWCVPDIFTGTRAHFLGKKFIWGCLDAQTGTRDHSLLEASFCKWKMYPKMGYIYAYVPHVPQMGYKWGTKHRSSLKHIQHIQELWKLCWHPTTFNDLQWPLMTSDLQNSNRSISSSVSGFQKHIIWWGSKFSIFDL